MTGRSRFEGGRCLDGEERTAQACGELRGESLATRSFRAGKGDLHGVVAAAASRLGDELGEELRVEEWQGVDCGRIDCLRPAVEGGIGPVLFLDGAEESFVGLPGRLGSPCRLVAEGMG